MHATTLWSVWLPLLLCFRTAFTVPGHRRFVQWATGLVLTLEDHTLTQALLSIDQADDWKALEDFVAHGCWDQETSPLNMAPFFISWGKTTSYRLISRGKDASSPQAETA